MHYDTALALQLQQAVMSCFYAAALRFYSWTPWRGGTYKVTAKEQPEYTWL